MTSSLDPDRRSDLNRRLDLDRRLDFDRRLAGSGDSEALLEDRRRSRTESSSGRSTTCGPGSPRPASAPGPWSRSLPRPCHSPSRVSWPSPGCRPSCCRCRRRRRGESPRCSRSARPSGRSGPSARSPRRRRPTSSSRRPAAAPSTSCTTGSASDESGRAGPVQLGHTGRSKASVLDFDRPSPGTALDVDARHNAPCPSSNLDHIGGINTLFHSLSQGGAVVTPAERTPDSVFATIAETGWSVLPTTPTFLTWRSSPAYWTSSRHLVAASRHLRHRADAVSTPSSYSRRCCRAPAQADLRALRGRHPADPVRSVDSLWVKLGSDGFAYKIVNSILRIRSDTAMLGYLNAPAPFDEEGYFNTQRRGRGRRGVRTHPRPALRDHQRRRREGLPDRGGVRPARGPQRRRGHGSAGRSPVTGEWSSRPWSRWSSRKTRRSLRSRVRQHCAAGSSGTRCRSSSRSPTRSSTPTGSRRSARRGPRPGPTPPPWP